jgi:hypothetical protein
MYSPVPDWVDVEAQPLIVSIPTRGTINNVQKSKGLVMDFIRFSGKVV